MPVTTDQVLFAMPLDVVLFAEEECLGTEWPMEIDGRAATVRFPALPQGSDDDDDDRVILVAPRGTPDALAERVELWGVLHRNIPVVDIYTLLISIEAEASIDWELEAFPAAGDDIERLKHAAHNWFGSFVHWIFCLTAQSLNVMHPDPKTIHRNSANAIQTVTAGDRCTRPEVASVYGPVVLDFYGGPSSERVLSARVAEVAVSRAGTEPSANLELLASARLFSRRHDFRRALIDAGTAAEGAMVNLLGTSVAGQTLGSLVNICKTVQIDAKVNLVDPRNDAVHRGVVPSGKLTARAIEIVEDLILQVEPDVVPAKSLRHVNRPQRFDMVIFRPNEKMVELSKSRDEEQQ